MDDYEVVMGARGDRRLTATDYIQRMIPDFTEFHGDRLCGDDRAVIAGIGSIQGMPVTVIGIEKGKNTQERIRRNFGSAHPEGYRKSLRLMQQAAKFHRPVLCIVDTAGAFCGVDAEEHGQGRAIADNLYTMADLPTPILSLIIGEGGSGGALALGVCDELAMLENAEYSVLSPRGFASILWKDASREQEASEIMKITAEDMVRLGVAEAIIEEPLGGAHNDLDKISENIHEYLSQKIPEKCKKDIDVLLKERYTKFRKIGAFTE